MSRALLLGISVVTLTSVVQALPAAQITAESLHVTPDHGNGIYRVGERVAWTFVASGPVASRPFEYVIRENNGPTVESGVLDLTGGAGRIQTRLHQPGMLFVKLKPVGPEKAAELGAADRAKLTLGAAVAPDRIRTAERPPADFDAFWAGKLRAQANVPINESETPISGSPDDVDMTTVTVDALGSKVHGYIAKPRGGGKYPALIIYQYAGVYRLAKSVAAARAREGWLVFNIQAHDMAPDEANAPATYFQIGNTDRESTYFLGMYLRASRALDYIRSRQDWDGHTVVLTGGSQGGQQSLVTAGLNPGKVTAVLASVPASANITGDRFGRPQGFPVWKSDNPAVVRTGRYYDIANFTPHITAPTLVTVGMIDIVAPPVGIFAAFNEIRSPKEAVLMVNGDHTLRHDGEERRINKALLELRTTGRLTLNKKWFSAGAQ